MILEKMFDKEDVVKSDEITKTEIDKIIKRLATLQDQFLDGNIYPLEYHSMKEKVEKDLIGLELKLKGLKQDRSPYK